MKKLLLIGALSLALFFNYIHSLNGDFRASVHDPRGNDRRTASGQLWHNDRLVAAHKHYPLGSYVRLFDPKTNKYADVEIIDRGPYVYGRTFDVSPAVRAKLGIPTSQGVFHVTAIEFPKAKLQKFLQ